MFKIKIYEKIFFYLKYNCIFVKNKIKKYDLELF